MRLVMTRVLPGAGAGEDQQRSVGVQDRFALFGIEGVEELHRDLGLRAQGLQS